MIGLLMLMSISATMITGCEKEKGEQGAAGTNGTNGKDGNANVAGSSAITLNNWSTVTSASPNFLFSDIVTWSGITQAIKDKGAVMVYIKEVSDTEWSVLPYSVVDNTSTLLLDYSFDVGKVTIFASGYDNTGIPTAADFNGLFSIRIIAIASSERIRLENNNVNLSDFKAVKEALHLVY